MNNAYYFCILQAVDFGSVDVGVGMMPHIGVYALDAVVIAADWDSARSRFANVSPEHYGDDLTLIQLLERAVNDDCEGISYREFMLADNLDEPEQMIERRQEHWLCKVVQHHPDVNWCARYAFGWQVDHPTWYREKTK